MLSKANFLKNIKKELKMKNKLIFIIFVFLIMPNAKGFVEDRFCFVKIIDNKNNYYNGIIHIDTRFLCCPDTTITHYHILYKTKYTSSIYDFKSLFQIGDPSIIEFSRTNRSNEHADAFEYLKKKYQIKKFKVFDLHDTLSEIFILQSEIHRSEIEISDSVIFFNSSSVFEKKSDLKIWVFRKDQGLFKRNNYFFEEKHININDVSFILYLPINKHYRSKLINEFTEKVWKKNRIKISMPIYFY